MLSRSTDADWEAFARADPYWAVVTDEAFRRDNLSEENRRKFLETGERYVATVWDVCRRHLDQHAAPRRALDFGCGVGRVAMALAARCEQVVGVDVSEGMLSEARTLCDRRGVTNIELVRGDDALASVTGRFDLVHTFLVLQHIPVARGLALVQRLIDLATPDGVVILHVLYRHPFLLHPWSRLVASARRTLRQLWTRVPEMQMNPYPLDDLLALVQDAGGRRVHLELTNHAGCRGVILFFRKGGGGDPIA